MRRFALVAILFLLLTGQAGMGIGGYEPLGKAMFACARHVFQEAQEADQEEQKEVPKEVEIAELESRAKEGDVEAQFRVGMLYPRYSKEEFLWYCRAANSGHAEAQWMVGVTYHHNFGQPVHRNRVKAYVWFSLSIKNGRSETLILRKSLVEDMTSEELAEAERLYMAWKPDPEHCVAELSETNGE